MNVSENLKTDERSHAIPLESTIGKENVNIQDNDRRSSSKKYTKNSPSFAKSLTESDSRKSASFSSRGNVDVLNHRTSEQDSKVLGPIETVQIPKEKRAFPNVTPSNQFRPSILEASSASKSKSRKSEATRENTNLTESIFALAGFKKKEADVLQIAESTVGEIAANEVMANLAAEMSSSQISSELSKSDDPIASRTRKSGDAVLLVPKLNFSGLTSTGLNVRLSEDASKPNKMMLGEYKGKRKSIMNFSEDSHQQSAKRSRVSSIAQKETSHSTVRSAKVKTERNESSSTPTFSRFNNRAASPASSAHRVASASAYTTPRNLHHRNSVGSAASHSSASSRTASAQRAVSARARVSSSNKAPKISVDSKAAAEPTPARSCSRLTVPISPRLSTSRRTKRPAESEPWTGVSVTNDSQSSSGSRLFTPGRLTVPRSPRLSQRSASRSRREDSETLQMRQVGC